MNNKDTQLLQEAYESVPRRKSIFQNRSASPSPKKYGFELDGVMYKPGEILEQDPYTGEMEVKLVDITRNPSTGEFRLSFLTKEGKPFSYTDNELTTLASTSDFDGDWYIIDLNRREEVSQDSSATDKTIKPEVQKISRLVADLLHKPYHISDKSRQLLKQVQDLLSQI